MNKQTRVILLLISTVAATHMFAAKSTPIKTLGKIFGDHKKDANRKKLDNTNVPNTPKLEELRIFLGQIDYVDVEKRANGSKSKQDLLKAARDGKKEQLRLIFPLPNDLNTPHVTDDEIDTMVTNMTGVSFGSDWSNKKWNSNGFSLPQNPTPVWTIQIPGSDDQGDNGKQGSVEKPSKMPKILIGGLLGAGIIWWLYNNSNNDKKDEITQIA